MPARRTSIVLLVLALLASVLAISAGVGCGSDHPGRRPPPTPAAATSARVVGQPPARYTIPANSYFSYPNGRGEAGHPRQGAGDHQQHLGRPPSAGNGLPADGNGTIRIATWSFKDWAIAHALVAAKNRGVSVQVVAAKGPEQGRTPSGVPEEEARQRLNRPGYPATVDKVSFARECRGSCRGRGGTPHAKYFMFTNVGRYHVPKTVIQTSMNLTGMGYQGQWNQAEVSHDPDVYDHFMAIYRETRIGIAVRGPAPPLRHQQRHGRHEFFPCHANSRTDP